MVSTRHRYRQAHSGYTSGYRRTQLPEACRGYSGRPTPSVYAYILLAYIRIYSYVYAGIRCLLNGARVQEASTSELVFKPDDIIAYVTRFVTIKPGDLIFTGTPSGVGCFRKPPLWLKHGDEIVCEIDGIGRISNRVQAIPARL